MGLLEKQRGKCEIVEELKDKLLYYAIFQKQEIGFGIDYPIFNKLFSFGNTTEEAYETAKKELQEYINKLIAKGIKIPRPETAGEIELKANQSLHLIPVKVPGDNLE